MIWESLIFIEDLLQARNCHSVSLKYQKNLVTLADNQWVSENNYNPHLRAWQ